MPRNSIPYNHNFLIYNSIPISVRNLEGCLPHPKTNWEKVSVRLS